MSDKEQFARDRMRESDVLTNVDPGDEHNPKPIK